MPRAQYSKQYHNKHRLYTVQHHSKHRLRSAASQQTQTAQCSAAEIELFILLFADDLTLLVCTVIGLQNQLNALSAAAKRLGWTVNLDKSKVNVVL